MRLAFFLCTAQLWALSSITQGPFKDPNPGHANMRIVWVSDVSAYTRWCWSTTSHSGATQCTGVYPSATTFTSNGQHTIHGEYFSGLMANTTYYYRACAFDGASIEACATEDSFTTAALPAVHPAPPHAPTLPDNTPPTCANGRLEFCSGGNPTVVVVGAVSGSCDDAGDGLVATYAAAFYGEVIQIPVNMVCAGTYPLVNTTTWDGIGRIVIESQGIANLIPGVRIGPADAQFMPTISGSLWATAGSGAGDRTHCYPGGFEWDDNTSTAGWYMHYCGQSGTTATVGNVVYNSADGDGEYRYNVTLSAASSTTPAVGQWGYMTGVGGIPRANGTFQVTAVTDGSHFIVEMNNTYAGSTSPTYTSGGTLVFYDWAPVSFTGYSGAAPSGSCTPGTTAASAWAYPSSSAGLTGNLSSGTYTNKNYSTANVWRCTAPNVWSRHYILYSSLKAGAVNINATFDLESTKHTWFVGLNFSYAPVYADPLLYRAGYTLEAGIAPFFQGGSSAGEFIYTQPGQTTDIIFDRIMMTRQWPQKGILLMQFDGTNMVLQNSYVQSTGSAWWGHEERGSIYNDAAAEAIQACSAAQVLIDNNYFEQYGIDFHFYDGCIGRGFNGSSHDITAIRNTFYRNFALIDQAPGSTVNYYTPLRQHFECKRCVNVKFAGNVCQGNLQNVSQGGCIAFGPESYNPGLSGAFGIPTSMAYASGTGTFTVASPVPSYTLNVGDIIWLSQTDATHLYTVATVGTGTFTVNSTNLSGLAGSNVPVLNVLGGDGVSNVDIRNNSFLNLPSIFGSYSHFSHDWPPYQASFDAFRFTNNFIFQLGPGGTGSGILAMPSSERLNCSGASGLLLSVWGGQVDWTVANNTIFQFNPLSVPGCNNSADPGSIIDFVNNDFPPINVQESEGLVYQNNLEWTLSLTDPASAYAVSGFTCGGGTGIASGTTNLNCFFTGDLPYLFTNNAILLAGGGSPASYPSPNYWADSTSVASPFVNPAGGNFNVLPSSPYVSGGTKRATTGKAQGADMNVLAIAQGQVSNVRVKGIGSSTATILFTAPDATACPVDVGVDPTWQTFTRVSDSSTSRFHSVALTSLPGATTQLARINCQVQRPVITFTTH